MEIKEKVGKSSSLSKVMQISSYKIYNYNPRNYN